MSVFIRFDPGALPFSWRCAIWPLIGQILVEKQYATTSQVLEARRNQLADAGKHLGEHLVALGYVTPSQIEEALRLQSRMRGGLAPEPKAEAPASRARILVADDDPALRGLLANLLEMRGFSVTVTGDGEEALAAFKEGSYDCVITDWMMPRRDGLELARAVKALNPLVQVIVLGSVGLRDVRAARQGGDHRRLSSQAVPDPGGLRGHPEGLRIRGLKSR